MPAPLPLFQAPYASDDVALARALFAGAALPPSREARVDALARDLVGAIRAEAGRIGGVEALLREYALSTKEGLALMVLAEALLRVPDAATADRLIEDKLRLGGFDLHATRSEALLVHASAWALGLSARIIQPGETPEGILHGLARRLGLPAVRQAARQAMRVMGNHFVLGETIEAALKRAGSGQGRLYRYSFDMLGEGARTAEDAAGYAEAYRAAIEAIGRAAGNRPLPDRPGISVKLSALNPRYEPLSRGRVMDELVPVLLSLARAARAHDLNFTVDAEEADRLELSLDVVAAVLADPSLAGWDGFGLAVQAYQKRCLAVIDHVALLAERLDRRLMVRLVKGAYWDTEVKRAQERGLADFPVFTRKSMTDLNYLAAAERLLAHRPRLFPQFATHNALTVASIVERAGPDPGSYEFQRLHGMGEALYAHLLAAVPGTACRTYAPVGGHRDLLAYLVRRLLENGANSSFVSQAADPAVPVATLLRRPAESVGAPEQARHAGLRRARDLFAPDRANSAGVEFGDRRALAALLGEIRAAAGPGEAAPLVDGRAEAGAARPVLSPIDGGPLGRVAEASPETADRAVAAARAGFRSWSRVPAESRAAALDRAADALEAARGRLLHLLQAEAGKTLDDAQAELREAVDFCRYYACEGRRLFGEPLALPGPAGESNRLALRGRGVFVAISPWNFPLAIFTGQVAAALMAGNAVVAKPAEQTPLVAAEAVRLLHGAGIPPAALQFVPGDGAVGARLVAHPAVAGVAFTGSTEVARAINRALAAKDGPIVPLIAETGGINAMLVDATALPEQVADDVVTSAFRSAGQRCSALRLLLVQEDVADRMIRMIAGAARELRLGDPRDPAVQIGPVIDGEAKARLDAHAAAMRRSARPHHVGEAPAGGFYVAPQIYEIPGPEALREEVFGPILHVARYAAADLDRVLEAIEATGYGLTLGVHSRIEATVARVVDRLSTGNVYVNRNIIGAVVGVQPFGGSGLSGTGPKAGGPHYLARFATEQTVTVNTAAAGGDAALLATEG
ncbi:delta-1-pyrroline-5-carboxylate dehydrogenase [Methylobacterium sp. 4-46]|uniref:bifunctional proline dehydrogenase/L-glutamate gamma-semialdehyde dehydrogenase PutA n=1 Tax=unclassified Methylobacterium TaxID=2615210 RepID=UPI000165C9C6|nr:MULTISPECIES: bifunctional proline dehydrogenase/L-glutamate gamma-semialdehyde dehydrogenase PutA [Methylobacterium]ACA16663.1 delta-1-pyrroline-5-carboxylate dehydrogenase [Methylobacterium sp. 4-46]WFT82365.1 bifunctional proline dehydrogenase/L-glutamate gamma-semialdehyde dehydrogenase PutA [Methylobacterium nodulans]